LLNSWVGLLISVMMIAAVVIRTALEDRSLSRELPGYSEYIQQVRYRLLPRIW
jgi:protein-S-isoprenylcysteine O-methyltransferase Ste14